MTPDEYMSLAQRTSSTEGATAKLTNGAMGLCGEAGEVADIIKKHLFQKHPLDSAHIAEELGDVCWYIAELCAALDISLSEVLEHNISKLEKRYPNNRFEAERSINR